MFFRTFCLSKSIDKLLKSLGGDDDEEIDPIIVGYKEALYKLYKKYKLKKIYTFSLRFLQASAGIGLTTMTTVNNPYFKDNVDQINIAIWYISLSNNIVNFLLEKTQSYNLSDEKLKIKLLASEIKKYQDNYKDYTLYGDDEVNKLKYFERCYQEILNKTPYEYLIYQGRRPSHATIDTKQRKLNILQEAWAENDEVDSIAVKDF